MTNYFANKLYQFQNDKSKFIDQLIDLDDTGEFDFYDLYGDDYDNSLELIEVSPYSRLNEVQQKFIFEAGFTKVYVNHIDGWETHYVWLNKEFISHKGWRRRYVKDETVNTNRGDGKGYYEINYWPESWGNQEIGIHAQELKAGYFRIISND